MVASAFDLAPEVAAPGPPPLLAVRDLHVSFPLERSTIYAVQGLDLEVRASERIGVVGESGSGKSVSALSVIQMVPAPGRITRGEIVFEGRDLLKLPRSGMRDIRGAQIGMIPQNPLTSLNPVITIEAHFKEVLTAHLGLDKQAASDRTVELLRSVGIPDAATRMREYPHRLSGGQRQRVMIALAMACQPRLLIADEPTTALDVTIQAQILELMDGLVESSHVGTILITHNLGIVAGHCDRVVVMYAGRVMETATVSELFEHPAHPYTLGLLRCIPLLSERRNRVFETIPGLPPQVTQLVEACPFAPRCPRADERCRQEAPQLAEIGPQHAIACFHPVAGTEYEIGSIRRGGRTGELPVTATPVAGGRLLEVEDLVVHYHIRGTGRIVRSHATVHAVDGVSFELSSHETLGLVGESGCGKTTTGRTVLHLDKLTSGHVRFEGRDLASLSSRELTSLRRHMQIVFQDPIGALNPRHTVGQLISEPLAVHGLVPKAKRRARVEELLDLVGLPADAVSRFPHEFSGGQCQRIGIARAIAGEPSLLVLDEPVSALDVSIQAQILQLLTDLQERLGLAYLFIAHDLAVVGQMSDRVAVMYLGKIVELSERDSLYARPHHPYTQALLSAIPVPDPALSAQRRRAVVSGEVPSSLAPPAGCRFHTRCPMAQDRCRLEEPLLRSVGSGHDVACHFAEEAARLNPFGVAVTVDA